MERLARYCWSLAVGIVGFFAGMLVLARFHTFENWQVGLSGLATALLFAIPTYVAVSRVAATADRRGVQLLSFAGALFLFGSSIIYVSAAFH
jgi:hypothetical protein